MDRAVAFCALARWRGFNVVSEPTSFMPIMFLGQVFGPTLAAFVMTGIAEGKPGVHRLIRRIVDWHVGIQWYLFVLIGIPAIMTLGTIVLPGFCRKLSHLRIRCPHWSFI